MELEDQIPNSFKNLSLDDRKEWLKQNNDISVGDELSFEYLGKDDTRAEVVEFKKSEKWNSVFIVIEYENGLVEEFDVRVLFQLIDSGKASKVKSNSKVEFLGS